MADLRAMVTWVDVREGRPEIGMPVAVAITGRYPAEDDDGGRASGEAFWLVRTMYYTDWFRTEDGVTHHDCFVDSDEVIRFPYDPESDDSVTHWAELPTLPGTKTHFLGGDDVAPALRHAWEVPAGA
ncbi:AQJ64_40280 family protein [Streptomyces sp. SID8014]|uniref:AQJ64_40280 family protein n=1 Tax=Streptomyces sp. SID8014 TaxID=2706097 RepID=UPI001941CDB7|nr:AQJ64_40280 family protein [Streptomyces sp. SID8014]